MRNMSMVSLSKSYATDIQSNSLIQFLKFKLLIKHKENHINHINHINPDSKDQNKKGNLVVGV